METIPTILHNASEECTWISETYDRYAAMLYAVLLDLCKSEGEANDMLLRIFKQLYTEHYFVKCRFIGLVALVQLAVTIAKKHGCVTASPRINTFKLLPLLHDFLFNDVSLDTLCQQSGLTRTEIARQACTELEKGRVVPASLPNIKTGLANFSSQP